MAVTASLPAPPTRNLYRAMDAVGGAPRIHPSHLGVRVGPGRDIEADYRGDVRPGTGGMSVVPDDPMDIHRHFRPRSLGGRGKWPVWLISSARITSPLVARQDRPTHWLIEPSTSMALPAYEAALAATAPHWDQAGV